MGRHGVGEVVLGGLVAAAVWSAPLEAQACSCGGESTLVAPIGDEHPIGAAVYFAEGCGGNLEAWSVTVDGAPAMLVNSSEWAAIRGVAIEPAPAMGAEVVLSVACNTVFGDPACEDPEDTVEKARFTIAGPDTTAPPAIDGVTLEQEDGEFLLGCDETSYDLRLAGVVDLGDAEPSTWVEISFTRGSEELAHHSLAIPASGAVEAEHFVVRSEIAGAETCVGVTVRDAAGNATELEQDCAEIGREGCGCTADPRPVAMLPLLGVVALVRRRRR